MELKQDPENFRVHGTKNKRLIKKSLKEFGAGRSVLVDKNDVLIAGNGVAEQWGSRPVRVVETDGTELIVVKRNDLDTNDEKRKRLALLDNHSSDQSSFDVSKVVGSFSDDFLASVNFEIEQTVNSLGDNHTNSNCDYPLVPVYDEKYSAFVIICINKTEEVAMRTRLNFANKAKSYKNNFLGETNIMMASEFLKEKPNGENKN